MKKAKDLNIFAKRLGELIKEHNLVHEDIAQAIGVTRQGVGKWVKGESVPDVLTVAKLAKFLGVSVDYLAGNSNIKSADVNIQAICEYTGLSEKCVKSIRGYLITPINAVLNNPSYEDPAPIIEDLKSRNKAFSDLLLSDNFYQIALLCWLMSLKYSICEGIQKNLHSSQNMPLETQNFWKNILSDDEDYIDLCRYRAVKEFNRILDMFDYREKKKVPDNGSNNPEEE